MISSSRLGPRLIAIACVVFLAAGCRPVPPPEDDFDLEQTQQEPGGPFQPADVSGLLDHLRQAGLPIGRVDIYDAENDPATRLGRPNQYVGKAIFQDERFDLVLHQGQDVISFQMCGGVVEVFTNNEDLEARIEALEAARAQIPGLPPEYQLVNQGILLRLGHVLTPDRAAEYEAALNSFQG